MIYNIPSLLLTQALTTKSLLGQLVLEEFDSFKIKQLTPTVETAIAAEADTTYYMNKNTGGTLVPLNKNMQSYVDLLNHRKKASSYISYQYLFSNVTKKILTLNGTYTFKEALVETEKFREKAGTHFYGAILRSTEKKDKLINPYHILTPISLMKRPDILNDQEKYTVLLYFYRNRDRLASEGYTKADNATSISYVDTLLNLILKCTNHKAEVIVKNTIDSFFKRNSASFYNASNQLHNTIDTDNSFENYTFTKITAQEISKEDYDKIDFTQSAINSSTGEELVAAHQVMVNGIFAPDYGVSLLKKNRGLTGTFLTPNVSCNIQSESLRNSLTWASVCTGRESQSSFEGISSLHCCNYASAYNPNATSEDSLILADLSIKKCAELYQKIKVLPVKLSDTPSIEELEAFNKDIIAYIDFMILTYSLDLPTIEARYQTILTTIGQTNGQKTQTFIQDRPHRGRDSSGSTTT